MKPLTTWQREETEKGEWERGGGREGREEGKQKDEKGEREKGGGRGTGREKERKKEIGESEKKRRKREMIGR